MNRILFLCLLMGIYSNAPGQHKGISFLEGIPLEEALLKAEKENKLIFIDCYTSWCGPCKALSDKTFSLEEVGMFFNNEFINVKYDMEKGEGKKVYEKFKKIIPGFPTMLLINAKGEAVHSIVGFRDGKTLIQEVKAGLDGKSLFALEKKYKAGCRDIDFMKDYIKALKNAYKKEDAAAAVSDFMQSQSVESLLNKDIWEIAGEYINDPYSTAYKFVIKNMDKYEYGLKVNRSALERDLSKNMRRSIESLLRKLDTCGYTPGLRDSIEQLKQVLNYNILKQSPLWLAKLKIADYKIEGNVKKVFEFIEFGKEINLFHKETVYLQKIYTYIADNLEDKDMLSVCLTEAIELQEMENKSLFTLNFYGVISKCHEKLGNKTEAETAHKQFVELKRINDAKVIKLYNTLKGETQN